METNPDWEVVSSTVCLASEFKEQGGSLDIRVAAVSQVLSAYKRQSIILVSELPPGNNTPFSLWKSAVSASVSSRGSMATTRAPELSRYLT